MADTVDEDSKARKRNVRSKSNDTAGDTCGNNGAPAAPSLNRRHPSHSARIRQGIVQETKREKREQRRIARVTMQSQSSVQKFYFALILNALLVFMGGVLYLKPNIFFGRASGKANPFQWPPHHLAILYPTGISPREDLPRFLNQYAIATDENQQTREAVRHLISLRNRLKPFQIFVTAWERKKVMGKYTMDDYCGTGFERTFDNAVEKGSLRHAEDLLHWCLLHTYQNDGFIHWNVTMKRSPISPAHQYTEADTLKGIVAKHTLHNRIHPSFLWLPKKRERGDETEQEETSEGGATEKDGVKRPKTMTTFDMNTQVPAKILPWLIQTAPAMNVWEYPKAIEEYLYQLIIAEGGEERWMILDAICDHDGDDDDATTRQQLESKFENRRILSRDCLQGEANCCSVYLPEDDDKGEGERSRTKLLRSSSSSDSRD